MDVDKFTKFLLSIIAFSLCLIALNPWISPTLANAEVGKGAMAFIAQDIKRIAGAIEIIEKHGIKALTEYANSKRIKRVQTKLKLQRGSGGDLASGLADTETLLGEETGDGVTLVCVAK